MIVCLCRGVSDRAVHEAVVSGACSLRELAAACRGAGTDCGSCRRMLAALLDRSRPAARAPLESVS